MKNFRDFPLLESKQTYKFILSSYFKILQFNKVLSSRWIGQGPLVDKFEENSQKILHNMPTVAVGSGTDALHLAYILANIKENDEVICPVFTCTATNIPFFI